MGILKRVLLVDTSDGYHRFHDWALVTTTLGAMAEPFTSIGPDKVPDQDLLDFDYTDDMNRIDGIMNYSLDKELMFLSGGTEQVCGGNLLPRSGR